jgi:predicted regulator of Ras-like GTPase activity (Roadblock/LC7/MglB family)
MSFDSILLQVLGECPGALGAALLGSDGLPIAQVTAEGPPELADEVAVLGVEFGRILDEARKAAAAAGAGSTLELAVRTERFHVLSTRWIARPTWCSPSRPTPTWARAAT